MDVCITEYDEQVFVNVIRAEGRAGIIKNMLASGMSPEQIAKCCQIDISEVKKVEAEMGVPV